MRLKQFLFIIFVMQSFTAYSQTLQSTDIDIFINGYDEIKEVFSDVDDEYYFKLENVFTYYFSGDEKRSKNEYKEFLDIEVPIEVEQIFQKVGWEINGHKKFWTIMNGFNHVSAEDIMDKEMSKMSKKTFDLDETDLKIIRERMDDLDRLFYPHYFN